MAALKIVLEGQVALGEVVVAISISSLLAGDLDDMIGQQITECQYILLTSPHLSTTSLYLIVLK